MRRLDSEGLDAVAPFPSAPRSAAASAPWLQDAFVPADSAQGLRSGSLSRRNLERLREHSLLSPGAQGERVLELQALLGIEATGRYDEATAKAVQEYQSKNGLLEDGLVGQQTWASLLNIPAVVGPGSALLKANIVATVDSYKDRGKLTQMIMGKITVNGHTYNFRNGGHGRGSAPLGDYTVTPHLWSRDDPPFTVDGVGWSFAVSDKYDPRVKDTRSELRIHPDGSAPGTMGCFGIIGNGDTMRRFREDMRAEFTKSGDVLTLRFG